MAHSIRVWYHGSGNGGRGSRMVLAKFVIGERVGFGTAGEG